MKGSKFFHTPESKIRVWYFRRDDTLTDKAGWRAQGSSVYARVRLDFSTTPPTEVDHWTPREQLRALGIHSYITRFGECRVWNGERWQEVFL